MSTAAPHVPEPKPDGFEVAGGVGIFRPTGSYHYSHAVDLIRRCIVHARETGLGKLLIVSTRLQSFRSPGVAARLEMARGWADAADGQVAIAIVARREFIDPEKIGVVAASTFGARTNVFESEAEALAWLRDH